MTNITQRLIDKDPTLKVYLEGDWTNPIDYGEVESTGKFYSFNDAGVEIETGEFLYGMIRVLKPANVLETGTHWGIGSAYMGQALKDNGTGQLDTLEFLPEIRDRAVKRFEDLGLSDVISAHFGDARVYDPGDKRYGFILLDTEPQTRFSELVRFYDYLIPGGFVFIHDLHRHMGQVGQNPDHPKEPFWPWGKIPDIIKRWVSDGNLRPMHFPTPRGLTGFYKPDPGDYQWR